MDCTHFRRHHLAYLDDTLPGDLMAAAQRHLLGCDRCAAHDTLVRRSLMVARSLPPIAPSAEFRGRLDARLAACRAEPVALRPVRASTIRPAAALAASALLGVLAWQLFGGRRLPQVALQPRMAMRGPIPVGPSPVVPLPAGFSVGLQPMGVLSGSFPTDSPAPFGGDGGAVAPGFLQVQATQTGY